MHVKVMHRLDITLMCGGENDVSQLIPASVVQYPKCWSTGRWIRIIIKGDSYEKSNIN